MSERRRLKMPATRHASARLIPMTCSLRFSGWECSRTYSSQKRSKSCCSDSMFSPIFTYGLSIRKYTAALPGPPSEKCGVSPWLARASSEAGGDRVERRHFVPGHAAHDLVDALFDLRVLGFGRDV